MKLRRLLLSVTAALLLIAASACSSDVPKAAAPSNYNTPSVMASDPTSADPTEGDAPLPSDEAEATEDPTDDDYQPLPFEGGTFTFENGVKVTTHVVKMEKWGRKSDFCDTCLNLVASDRRFVLKYIIAVPRSFHGTIDPSSCGGQLSVDNGNDDEAHTTVAGDYNKDIEGTLRAGQTKFGQNEYGIKKKYENETFSYTNSCGYVDVTGEEGDWNGKVK